MLARTSGGGSRRAARQSTPYNRGICGKGKAGYSQDMNTLQKTFSHGAKRSRGREFIRRDGARYYINHYPRYSMLYFAKKDPEEVEEILYQEGEDEVTISGYKLLKTYDGIKANASDHLQETEGPYDQNSPEPYILSITHRLRL
jgi:hypothetical protein